MYYVVLAVKEGNNYFGQTLMNIQTADLLPGFKMQVAFMREYVFIPIRKGDILPLSLFLPDLLIEYIIYLPCNTFAFHVEHAI